MNIDETKNIFKNGMPIKYRKEMGGLPDDVTASIMLERNECIRAISDTSIVIDCLSRADLLVKYAGTLLGTLLDDLEYGHDLITIELVTTLINASYYYQEISLDTMERAYGTIMANAMWSTSGSYLKKGYGLLEFVMGPYVNNLIRNLPIEVQTNISNVINEMILEFQFLQQVGIVVLSLSKLRSRMYRDQKDAMLDFQDSDLNDLSANSIMYSKLVIGCLETCSKCGKNPGNIINKAVVSYLNSLVFLLLSLDQYSRDECGLSVGMIDCTLAYLKDIVPNSQINDSIISKGRKKREIIKDAFRKNKKIAKNAPIKINLWSKRSKNGQLLPLLQETLDDFLIQLAVLLRYRYIQTNEKLSFKPIEHNEAILRKFFPRSISSELQGNQWVFDDETGVLQEVSTTSINESNVIKYY